MKNILLIGFACVLNGFLMAQTTTPKYITVAKTAYESGKYNEAMPKLEAAYNKMTNKGKSITEKGEMAFLLAECYRHMEQYDKANQWYGSSVELKYYDVNPKLYYYQGEMQRMMGEFKNAEKSYTEYKKRRTEKSINVDALILSCDQSESFHIEESKYIVKHEAQLNSEQFDMAPFISDKKEGQIFFGTQREAILSTERDPITGEKFMDIWSAEFNDKGAFTSAKSIDDNGLINTKDNEGTAVLDKKGTTLYFTRCGASQAKKNLGCEIWTATKNGETWDNVMKIEIRKRGDSMSVGHPCISADGSMLIFASNMPGGIGGKDLWYVGLNKKTKTWDSIPVNMGSVINTAGNELFPTLGANDSLLFFASDGHPGIGGLDIFKASKMAPKEGSKIKEYGDVKNMMKPINSIANDYALTMRRDLKSGFFTSERSVTKNRTYKPDIFSFSTPPITYDLRVIVYELGNRAKKIDGANVTVNEIDGKNWDGLTDSKGKTVKWDLRKEDKTRYINGGKDYEIKASKARYFPMAKGTKVTTKGDGGQGVLEQNQSFVIEIPLIPIILRTPEVRYPLDKWSFINDNTINSKDSLEFLVKLLADNPDIEILLFSHTDSRDTEIHNQALSSNRAKAVYNYLVAQDPKNACRIVPTGLGESEPAIWQDENGADQTLTETYINQFKGTPKFEMLHQLNRRTTVKIVMEEGTDMPKTHDYSAECTPDPQYFKYTDPLPR